MRLVYNFYCNLHISPDLLIPALSHSTLLVNNTKTSSKITNFCSPSMGCNVTKMTELHELVQIVRKSFTLQSIDLICFLARLLFLITEENAPAILGVMHDLFQVNSLCTSI